MVKPWHVIILFFITKVLDVCWFFRGDIFRAWPSVDFIRGILCDVPVCKKVSSLFKIKATVHGHKSTFSRNFCYLLCLFIVFSCCKDNSCMCLFWGGWLGGVEWSGVGWSGVG